MRNAFEIGIFAANCSGGIACTTVPERWQPTWENNRAIAEMADEAGLEFMLPLGRWAGYGGETDHNGVSFETLTWASGLLACTRKITVFSTVHVALLHPVSTAKQMVTADHIGQGRFGLNIVCGWNTDEFDMFGVELKERDGRYAQGQEWLDIVKRLWAEDEPFDFDGAYYRLHNARAQPKPVSKPRPMLMSAGTSEAGLDFAVRNANVLFRNINTLELARADVARVRQGIASRTDPVDLFTSAYVVCRPTRQEAEDYHTYYAVEHADPDPVERMFVGRGIKDDPRLSDDDKFLIKRRLAGGNGAYALVGDPDDVADQMEELLNLGFRGIAMGLVNYTRDFPYIRDEVLPRLERKGLRGPVQS